MLPRLALALGLAQAVAATSWNKTYDSINYGAFTQTATYSIAQELGFFSAYGLNVTYQQVPNSTYAEQQVLSGGYDILTWTIDNAVNFRLNSNVQLTVLGQLDQGPGLALASVPNITSVQQLKGKALIVDSAVSGYAYLLQKILSQYGLWLANGDYSFTAVGGTNVRYADLLAGSLPNGTPVYATMLLYPFTAEGQVLPSGQAPNILAAVSQFVSPISSSAFTTSQAALSDPAKVDKLTRFMAAMYAANLYLFQNGNQHCSIAAIQAVLGVSKDVAKLEYAAATDSVTGEVSTNGNFTVNQNGLLNVINVRSQFNGFSNLASSYDFVSAIVPGVGKLIDYTIRDAAVAALKSSLLQTKCKNLP
ncbi:pe_pgrs family protein [Rutstroemia sp. NJR-2017a BVV2]|nr:pe_pgrs family protein [Rutstroemia sp. NJR-2017a BVV2]